MNFYPTDTDVPNLMETEGTALADKTIHARYVMGHCEWLIAEYDPETGEAFGYANLGDAQNAEWGYIPLDQLEGVRMELPVRINGISGTIPAVVYRDENWEPKCFRDVVGERV